MLSALRPAAPGPSIRETTLAGMFTLNTPLRESENPGHANTLISTEKPRVGAPGMGDGPGFIVAFPVLFTVVRDMDRKGRSMEPGWASNTQGACRRTFAVGDIAGGNP